ncbi:MAG: SurA N-terminal domain-containing protein [Candidatus Amulumruptor caecigallinarius]|nr:SurA N-terminal domain-containing protein [Candidatus Amulumruptor caecigallinarius]
MATLEKIRSKSVFLIVVIGVALLAFIVGDALTNSRNIFGDQTTVAKIGSTKIDYTDYQRKREELNQQLEEARRQNPEQFANFDTQILPQMALEQLLQEAVLLDAADEAGVRSSGNLLRQYMLENANNPEVIKIVRQLNASGLSVQTPQQAYEVIFNPKRNGLTDAQAEPFQRAWLAAEKATERQLKMNIYQRLLVNSVKANDLDKKALYNDYVTTSNVDLAFLPYGNIDAKAYPVSDKEIEAKYKEEKELYKVELPTKEVSFIAVNIAPSDADQKASKELAAKTAASLAQGGQLDKNIKKEGVSVTRHSLRANDIPAGALKDFVLAGGDSTSSKVKVVSDNALGFKVVRLAGRTAAVDSIKVNIVSAAGDKLGNRVLAALNSGLPADSVSKKFSADSVAAQTGQWVVLYTADGPTNALPKETLDSLMNAGGKYITVNSTPQGAVMAQVVEKKSPVTIYEYDEADYTLAPSQKTRNDVRDAFEKFIGANNTAEKFSANAAKAGYNVQNFILTADNPAIPRFQGMDKYYPDSRQVVRWVMMDSDKGEVSHIYSSQDATMPMLYAVAIDDQYEDYVPVTNKAVREALTERIRHDKAGDKMVADYSKKAQSIQSAANAMGVQVRNLPSMRFGTAMGVNDPGVIGKINGAKADKKVNVVKGIDGVYVYQVNAKNKENFPYTDQMYDQQYFQFLRPNMALMLKGNKKYKNNIYKFEAGE